MCLWCRLRNISHIPTILLVFKCQQKNFSTELKVMWHMPIMDYPFQSTLPSLSQLSCKVNDRRISTRTWEYSPTLIDKSTAGFIYIFCCFLSHLHTIHTFCYSQLQTENPAALPVYYRFVVCHTKGPGYMADVEQWTISLSMILGRVLCFHSPWPNSFKPKS